MDAFLAQNGFCRKLLVKDNTCIFRAVSEKLFLTQTYHHHVRQTSAEYMWRHQEEFQECECNSPHRELTGVMDMLALSKIYQLEFFVFHQPGMSPINITQSGHSNEIWLVTADNGHYDLVQTRTFVQDLALCQSVIYEVLYRGVFGLSTELEEAVGFIRQQKRSTDTNGKIFTFPDSLQKLCEKESLCPAATERATPPLPYRIAKALDPVLYRNVELDIVQEEKREIKLRLQGRGLYGVFCPGDKCQVQLEEDNPTVYNAHVQEINEPKGPVVVFIEELGEKKTVSYSCLRPLPLNASKQGSDSQRLPVAQLGPVPFGDRRARRRKNTMPGAAEFQAPATAGRSPRSAVVRRGPDAPQNALTAVSSQPVTVDCMGVADSMEGAGYCVVTTSLPMPAQTPMGAVPSSPGAGQGTGGGVVYWMPVVTVPYASNMGQVNLAWAPSQDPYGKDLPLTDMNTLRYFFNLGVEYFRISANMQQQQQPQQQPQQNYLSSSPLPPLIPGGPSGSSVLLPLEQGASFATPDPPKHRAGTYPQHMPAGKATPTTQHAPRPKGNPRGSGGGQEGASKSESMEMSSDVSDSGCTSCGEGGQGGGDDDIDAQMELASNRTDEDSGSTHGGEEGGSEKGGKGKGKRKYYMYGPHKLIKPIKDIPPRFQMMLAENSAAKARCEGQPIYMQLSPADFLALEQAGDSGSGLNADAQCFYPGQQFDTVMVDDPAALTAFAGTGGVASSNHPPPILVPPPPVMQAGSQSPASVVYSTVVSSSALPPPAYSRPLPAAVCSTAPTVHSGDGGKMLPAVAASANRGKGSANSGPEKRPEEFAGPSSGKTADLVNSPRVSVASLSVSTAPQPFPAPTSMPPPPAPPLHAGTAPNSVSSAGGGKQCFYVYPSRSTGFPSLPATPPQGQSHAPGISQGQVVYVMNPQGYGPTPPCTAYQPSVMASPAYTMAMPCPPVAVQ